MTIEEKMKKYDEITTLVNLYLEGALATDEALNQIILIVHNGSN